MGRANLGQVEPLRVERNANPVHEIFAIDGVIEVLNLAPAAFREMAARRYVVPGARGNQAALIN
jgi:hypothetical protein